jgi:ankyrin repeat protein
VKSLTAKPAPQKGNDQFTKELFELLSAVTLTSENSQKCCALLEKANISAKNKEGDTLLHLACKKGHVAIVTKLLDKGADKYVPNIIGWYPLHCVASNNHAQIIDILVERGATIDAKNGEGNSPLHLAAEAGHLNAVKVLLDKKANVSARNKCEETPLHIASSKGNVTVVQLLLTNNAEGNSCNAMGWSALHYATEKGYPKVVKALLSGGAKADLPNKGKLTPLYYAAMNGYSKRENAEDSSNKEAHTPLYIAKDNYIETIKLLLEKGAIVSEKIILELMNKLLVKESKNAPSKTKPDSTAKPIPAPEKEEAMSDKIMADLANAHLLLFQLKQAKLVQQLAQDLQAGQTISDPITNKDVCVSLLELFSNEIAVAAFKGMIFDHKIGGEIAHKFIMGIQEVDTGSPILKQFKDELRLEEETWNDMLKHLESLPASSLFNASQHIKFIAESLKANSTLLDKVKVTLANNVVPEDTVSFYQRILAVFKEIEVINPSIESTSELFSSRASSAAAVVAAANSTSSEPSLLERAAPSACEVAAEETRIPVEPSYAGE